ncbi:hypothetical protein BDZ45DRAFT_505752 [Acephala macrosclerotiorum]|nr:hypothetical protein BDZ45DRAFT_505752 [Acephala macrosclerotiorum]
MAPPQHQNTSFDTYRVAHALVTAVAFLFFAIGGIWLRFSKAKHAVQYHAYFQIFNTALMIVGFGFGVYLCQINPRVSNPSSAHPTYPDFSTVVETRPFNPGDHRGCIICRSSGPWISPA